MRSPYPYLDRVLKLCAIGALIGLPLFWLVGSVSGQPKPATGVFVAAPLVTDNPISAARQPGGSTALPNIYWALAGVEGGVPTNLTQCGSTLPSSSSRTDINSAISSCSSGGGGYVLLGTGTFNLDGPPILQNNVELRGSGMATILNVTGSTGSTWGFGGGEAAIVIAGSQGGYSGEGAPGIGYLPGSGSRTKTWTGTNGATGVFTQGSTVLNLDSTSGMSAGDFAVCWQNNDSAASTPSTSLFVSEEVDTVSSGVSWNGESADYDAGMEQRSEITQVINGTSIQIADPILMPTGAWKTGASPKCGYLLASEVIHDAGVRNLLLRTSNWTGNHNCDACIIRAHNVWVVGVGIDSDVGTWHNGDSVDFAIAVSDSTHVTVRNNWIDTIIGGGQTTTTSYGVALQQAHHTLVENNIFYDVESPVEVLVGVLGSVYAYNYEIYLGGQAEGGFQQHSVAAAMNLVEGNYFQKFLADVWHGNTHFTTVHRNYFFDIGVDLWSYNRWYNILGNIIANSEVYTALATDVTKYDRWADYGFRLGYPQHLADSTMYCNSGCTVTDSLVWTSLFRWGNYTAADTTTRWASGEVPTSDPLYPNAVPGTQSVPTSFYRSSRPGFFTLGSPINVTVAWPPIGPEVTGGVAHGGRVHKLPAQLAYEQASGSMASWDPTWYGVTP